MSSYTVAQNTSFLTAASILQKVISFVYFTIIARVIGVGNTGEYFFAIAFTTIFTVIADFGMGPILTRETAKYPENSEKYLNTVFWTKVLFGLGAYFLVIFFINLLQYPISIRHLVYLSGVTMFFDNLHSAFYSVFRGRKNLIYESIGIVGSQFITLVIGSFALLNHWSLIWLIAAYTIPSCLNALYSGYFALRVYSLRLGLMWSKEIFKTFFLLALPFAIAGIISRLYAYTDSIIISKTLQKEHLGWWSVPYKITFAFQFIPVALSASVFPAMSSLLVADRARIGNLFEKSWRYLFAIVFPLSFGLIALSGPVITKLYTPAYLPAVSVLRILVISLIFGFLSFITGALLNATNHQKIQTALLGLALVVNVILNLLLLPKIGINGAAISALVGNITLWLGGYYFSSKYVKLSHRNIFKYANQALWPALIMAIVVYYLSLKINFIFTIPIGMVVYGILFFLAGGFNVSTIKNIWYKIRPKETI